MNMVCLPIYLNIWFLSSALCSYQYINLAHIVLDSCLSISFLKNCKFIVFLIRCPWLLCQHVEIQFIFICLPCILWPCWTQSSSYSLLVDYLKFSIQNVMSSASRDGFISLFLIHMLFISFPCLTELTRTPSTRLNKSSKTGHTCFVFDN